jgi:hypothetical protein
MAFVARTFPSTDTTGAMSTTATNALVGSSLVAMGAVGIGTCLGLAPASTVGMTLAAASGAGLIHFGCAGTGAKQNPFK